MAKKRRKARARNENAPAELYLFDAIDPYFGIAAQQVVEALREASDAEEVRLCVNSPGGDVFEGLAIYRALKAHPGRVVACITGLAASIASIIVLGADEVRIAPGAMMMIHEARVMSGDGTSQSLRKEAELLDKLNQSLVDIYLPRVEKQGKTREDLVAAMAAETWFTAEEAVAWGLADNVDEDVETNADVVALGAVRPRG